MKKWLVIVNKKWLVSVEADTNGWAENLALDAVGGNNSTALAFDPETEGHLETYRTLAAKCDTIRYGELCNMRNCKVAMELEQMNRYVKAFDAALAAMKRCEKDLAEAHEWLSIRGRWDGWVEELRELTDRVNKQNKELIAIGEDIKQYAKMTGHRDVVVSDEVLAELRVAYYPLKQVKIYD